MEKKKERPQNKNLRNIANLPPEEAFAMRSKAGKEGSRVRKERKKLKETLLMLLKDGNVQEDITLALLQQAMNGNVKAYEVIRDTIGEKPVEVVEMATIDTKVISDIENLVKCDGK